LHCLAWCQTPWSTDGFATKDIDVSADGKRLVYGVNGHENLPIINSL
jgi:hypothetical protein